MSRRRAALTLLFTELTRGCSHKSALRHADIALQLLLRERKEGGIPVPTEADDRELNVRVHADPGTLPRHRQSSGAGPTVADSTLPHNLCVVLHLILPSHTGAHTRRVRNWPVAGLCGVLALGNRLLQPRGGTGTPEPDRQGRQSVRGISAHRHPRLGRIASHRDQRAHDCQGGSTGAQTPRARSSAIANECCHPKLPRFTTLADTSSHTTPAPLAVDCRPQPTISLI